MSSLQAADADLACIAGLPEQDGLAVPHPVTRLPERLPTAAVPGRAAEDELDMAVGTVSVELVIVMTGRNVACVLNDAHCTVVGHVKPAGDDLRRRCGHRTAV